MRFEGAFFDVFNALGPMVPEAYVRDAIAIRLEEKDIRCQVEKEFELFYRGVGVGRYRVDIWVEDGKLLVATIAVQEIGEEMKMQLRAKMRHHDVDFGLIANFHGTKLDIKIVRRKATTD